MPELHLSDELLDEYALGTLAQEQLAGLEEHLLFCQACQSRLEASDEFTMLFREAAVQPDARSRRSWRLFAAKAPLGAPLLQPGARSPGGWRLLPAKAPRRAPLLQPGGWRLLWNYRVAGWTGAAAVVSAILLFVAGPFHKPPIAPATVFLQSLRGPDAPAQVTPGRPALLVFDIVPAAGVNEYEARIVNPVGVELLSAPVSLKDGRLAVLVDSLSPGSYWVRVYRTPAGSARETGNRDPIAEYGLRAR